tara:strand:- start:229 stop:483 length:255 start_codon:yes stop_codon:yes gene_type:complete
MKYNKLLSAAIKKYEAEISECLAILEIYFTNAVAIGEHPDLLAEVDKYIDKLEMAEGKLEILNRHFLKGSNTIKDLLQERQPGE